ncbi:hypothetical protein H257_04792 [Aphanomyces astaci]|uniref:Uncharacterized protein n=1 Tax=Aphanomyces astaci TaxID=112090 RepID=W4GVL5_APHAT|nr:hypothetical protein H257_04792 [Aphanomyces astaci]ETV83049.1 hypothetical protein H257_04792 [Aphanomyces astaci]|eukprot:XP_009827720.1 hypothetical protein H257_04792 [Aphanomyces astaci]
MTSDPSTHSPTTRPREAVRTMPAPTMHILGPFPDLIAKRLVQVDLREQWGSSVRPIRKHLAQANPMRRKTRRIVRTATVTSYSLWRSLHKVIAVGGHAACLLV